MSPLLLARRPIPAARVTRGERVPSATICLRLSIGGCRFVLGLTGLPRLGREAARPYRTFSRGAGRVRIRLDLGLCAVTGRRALPAVERDGRGWRLRRADFDVRGGIAGTPAGVPEWRFAGQVADQPLSLDSLLRVILSVVLPHHDGLLLHAAGLRIGARGVAFAGRSGLGKTTMCRQAPRASVLNDELVVLSRTPAVRGSSVPGRWTIHPTPFWGELAVGGGAAWRDRPQRSVPLAGIAHLARGRRGAPPGATGILGGVLHFGADPECAARLLRLAALLATEVPQIRWRFALGEAWPALVHRLRRAFAAATPR